MYFNNGVFAKCMTSQDAIFAYGKIANEVVFYLEFDFYMQIVRGINDPLGVPLGKIVY